MNACNKWVVALALAIALTATGPAAAEELVVEFRGDRSMATAEFEIRAPWLLDWRVTGDAESEMAVDASLVRAGSNVHEGNVLKTKNPGNGARLFKQGGKFFFRVDSTFAGWTFRVYQLTEAEAELYTPKDPNRLDY